MRPLELTVEGFKSYRGSETFNFDGRGLFGIVGPTGAGKSSLLDALVYALYGKTPRLEKETRRLINSQCEEAKVRLVFDVDDVAWEVTRLIRHKGAAPVVLRKLGETTHEATGAGAVSERIESLVGLDFRAFCSSVTLPQGEFDRFLRAAPADRARVLKGIFRLERVDQLREIAKERRAEVEGTLMGLRAALTGLPEDPKQLLEKLTKDLDGARSRAEELKNAITEEARIGKALDAARSRMEELEKRSSSTELALGKLPDAATLEDLAEVEDSLQRSFDSAIKESATAEKTLEKALKEEEDQREILAAESLPQAKELALDHRRIVKDIESTNSEIVRLEKEFAESTEFVGEAEKNLKTATETLRFAEAKLVEVHRTHDAHRLRAGLKAGDPCPVCGAKVSKLEPGKAPDLDAAEKLKIKAAREEAAARLTLEEKRRVSALAESDLSGAKKRSMGIGKQLSELTASLTDLIGSSKNPLEEVARREAALVEAGKKIAEIRFLFEQASKREREAQSELEKARKKRFAHVETLIKICERLDLDAPTFEDDASSLLGTAKRAEDAGAALIKEFAQEQKAKAEEIASWDGELIALRHRLELAEEDSVAEALAQTTERIGALQSEAAKVRDALKRRGEIDKEMAQLVMRGDFLEMLVSDLADSRFPAYLLDGHRRLLSELGSENLFGLTGRYRFDDQGEFQILDEATGVTRSPETLSGGETFLASLALALAMAEAVTQQGGRLDCFFLDEGFGSLDGEFIDIALEGIEKIATPGRLIGLISHQAAVQARLDDLILLQKGEDGTTQVEQTEGPLAFLSTI